MSKLGLGIGAASLILAALPALAQGSSSQRAACTPDVFRLCSGDIPNVSRITACLKRERPKLSSGCGAVFDALDKPAGATRAYALNSTPSGAWCEFGANPAPGQDVWIAWCGETPASN